MERSRALACAGLVLAALIGTVGCGDDSAEDSGGGAGTTIQPAESTGADTGPTDSSSDGGDTGLAAAQAVVDQYSQPVPLDYDPGPLNGSVEGKKFICIAPPIPNGVLTCELFKKGAEMLGATVETGDAGDTAEETANKFDELANDTSYQALYVIGYEPSAWKPQFEKITGRGVTVILAGVKNDPEWQDLSANVLSDVVQKASNAYAADWIIADSEAQAETLYVNIPLAAALVTGEEGFRAEYTKNCPECKLETVNADGFEAIGKDIPGIIVSYLQANPDTKYVMLGFGDMLTGVSQALDAAGISGVKLSTVAGSELNYQMLMDGSQAMLSAYPFTMIHTYVAVDVAARGVLEGPQAAIDIAKEWTVSLQIITAETADDGALQPDGTVAVEGVDEHFARELWGL